MDYVFIYACMYLLVCLFMHAVKKMLARQVKIWILTTESCLVKQKLLHKDESSIDASTVGAVTVSNGVRECSPVSFL